MIYEHPIEPVLKGHIFRLANRLAKHRGIKLATLSKDIPGGSARFYKRIGEGGASFTINTYDRMMAQFSADWPADLEWPADIPRHAPAKEKADG